MTPNNIHIFISEKWFHLHKLAAVTSHHGVLRADCFSMRTATFYGVVFSDMKSKMLQIHHSVKGMGRECSSCCCDCKKKHISVKPGNCWKLFLFSLSYCNKQHRDLKYFCLLLSVCCLSQRETQRCKATILRGKKYEI